MRRELLCASAASGVALLVVAATAGEGAPAGLRAVAVLAPAAAVAVGTWFRSVVATSAGLLATAAAVGLPLVAVAVPASEAALWAVALALVVELSLRALEPAAPPHSSWVTRTRTLTPVLAALAAAPATAVLAARVPSAGRVPAGWGPAALLLLGGVLVAVLVSLVRPRRDSPGLGSAARAEERSCQSTPGAISAGRGASSADGGR